MFRRQFFTTLIVVALVWTFSADAATKYVEGEVLVTFKESATLDDAQQTLGKHALKFAEHYAGLSDRRHRQIGLVREKTRTTAQLITTLQAEPGVEAAEPNYLRWTNVQPSDGLFPEMWSFQNGGQSFDGTAGTTGADVKFVPAWSLARPSASQVVVAVIDTGADYVHPDLAGNIWTNPGEIPGNGVDDDGNGYVDDYYGYDFVNNVGNPTDSGYHGTHVAGTIAAVGNNQLGVIGINYRAKIMALKVSSDGSSIPTSAVISALQYATLMKGRGVNVVAMNGSFGGGGSTTAESSAIQAAGTAGIIFCVAAGNSAANNDTTATYPASYRLSNMIVVAASDQNDALASFSNYGATTVDLAAPGVNILSTAPAGASGANTFFQVNGSSFTTTPLTYSGTASAVAGAVYYCGLGNPGDFPAGVSGNIALIQRGTLTFATKVTNAMAAGARAAIIYNNVSGTFAGTLSTAGSWIPAEALSQADGQAIVNATLPAQGFFSSDYQLLAGTSMATPHVTGAVAFAAMNFPNETVAQRIQRVLANVDVKPGLQGKVASGGRLNLQRIVDADNNGLPDWWESTYFGHLTGTDPNADPDGDGMTNLQEFLAGTSPTDPTSRFAVSAFVEAGPYGQFTVTWSAVAGKIYQVLYSDSLGGPWLTTLPNSRITAGAASVSYPDTTSSGAAKRFYRVMLVVP